MAIRTCPVQRHSATYLRGTFGAQTDTNWQSSRRSLACSLKNGIIVLENGKLATI